MSSNTNDGYTFAQITSFNTGGESTSRTVIVFDPSHVAQLNRIQARIAAGSKPSPTDFERADADTARADSRVLFDQIIQNYESKLRLTAQLLGPHAAQHLRDFVSSQQPGQTTGSGGSHGDDTTQGSTRE